MANVSNANGVFTGISELYLVSGGFGDGFSGGPGTEVPVAEESGFTYTGGTPSTERYRIHGLSAPWAVKMTPGDAEVNIFIPQITDSILGLCGYTTSSASATGIGGKKWTGTAWGENSKEVVLGIAAINRTGDQLFAIKKVQVLASIVFDDANSAKPIGVQLTGASTSSADDSLGIFTVDANG